MDNFPLKYLYNNIIKNINFLVLSTINYNKKIFYFFVFDSSVNKSWNFSFNF
jgi:hypothetical protein